MTLHVYHGGTGGVQPNLDAIYFVLQRKALGPFASNWEQFGAFLCTAKQHGEATMAVGETSHF
jgi:hypothetical protein